MRRLDVDVIFDIPSELCDEVPSDGVVKKRRNYSGSIAESNKDNTKIFYRYRIREYEVIAGYAKEYFFGIEQRVIPIMKQYNAEYIVIETEFNYWEISLFEFIEKHVTHAGLEGVLICSETHFPRTKKEGLTKEQKDKNIGLKDPEVRSIRREAEQNAYEEKAKNNVLIEEQKNKKKKTKPKPKKDKTKFGKQTSLF